MVVLPENSHGHGGAPKGVDVVDGIGAPAQPHVGTVVLENEDRRLAADPLDTPVQKLVGDEVRDDEDAPTLEGVDETQEALGRGKAGAPSHVSGFGAVLTTRSTASRRFSATRSGWRVHEWE